MKGFFIMGRAGAGKTTVGEMIVEELGRDKVKLYALADPIKQLYMEFFLPVQGKPRAHLQLIGQSFRQIDGDVWIRALDRAISAYPTLIPCIHDGRQPNEYNHYVAAGFTTIRVDAPLDVRIERMKTRDGQVDLVALDHPTEHMLDDVAVDFAIYNDGHIDELREAVREVLRSGERTTTGSTF